MRLIKILLTLCCYSLNVNAQQATITILDSSHKASLRGLSVVDDNVLWVSGSSGSVARSMDGGKTFEWITVPGYEKRDFRDIEAFDANTAIIMGIAEPAVILKTKDGGKSWYKVFEDSTKGMFLDAMSFDREKGAVVGDPINHHAFIAVSEDGGEHWTPIPADTLQEGEAFFASSGTNNTLFFYTGEQHAKPFFAFASGGTASNFYFFGPAAHTADKRKLPIIQGKESTGANSLDYNKKNGFVVVGGDFANDKDTTLNCVLSHDMGTTWIHPHTPPHGYRSCVIYITNNQLITCGTSGVDISNDGGMNWQLVSNQSFHVVQKAKKGNAVFLAGSRGKIARLSGY
ncbi:oxidoreductase [Russula earlei]|uniref:Oxidoreductase n=1 Tax=Russula earlei TaxID=71964 RepID=A0ACC0TR32_9AGAM|nr:oxidoreductase [Russula earlei]